MENVTLKAFRFKEEGEIATEVMLMCMNREISVDEARKKINKTESFFVIARPLELSNRHRCIEFTHKGEKFIIHSNDVRLLLEDQEFEVRDLRRKS